MSNSGIEESKQDEENIDIKKHQSDSFSAMSIVFLLMRYKYFIIIFVFLATGASVLITLNMDNWYSSTINLVPPKQSNSLMQGGMGGISSALKDFGLTKLGSKAGAETYDLMVILESRTIKDSMIFKFNLAETYDIPDTLMSEVRKEFEANLDITYEAEGNYTITIWDKSPVRAAEMVKQYVLYTNNLARSISHRDASLNRSYLEQRIAQTNENIFKMTDTLQKYSKKYFIFAPEEQASAITKSLADLKAELIKQEVSFNMIQNRFGEKDQYTQMQKDVVDDLRLKLNNIENKPGFAGNFSVRNSLKVGAEFLKLYAELETNIKVKTFLLPMLEEAKIDEIKNTLSLTVVDDAIPADKKSRPKRSLYVAGTALGSFILSVLFVVSFNGFRNVKRGYQIYKNNFIK
jgi:capsule polysaccharide export protein KpsE/RkpR